MNRRAAITRLWICGLTACVLCVVSMYNYATSRTKRVVSVVTVFGVGLIGPPFAIGVLNTLAGWLLS